MSFQRSMAFGPQGIAHGRENYPCPSPPTVPSCPVVSPKAYVSRTTVLPSMFHVLITPALERDDDQTQSRNRASCGHTPMRPRGISTAAGVKLSRMWPRSPFGLCISDFHRPRHVAWSVFFGCDFLKQGRYVWVSEGTPEFKPSQRGASV